MKTQQNGRSLRFALDIARAKARLFHGVIGERELLLSKLWEALPPKLQSECQALKGALPVESAEQVGDYVSGVKSILRKEFGEDLPSPVRHILWMIDFNLLENHVEQDPPIDSANEVLESGVNILLTTDSGRSFAISSMNMWDSTEDEDLQRIGPGIVELELVEFAGNQLRHEQSSNVDNDDLNQQEGAR